MQNVKYVVGFKTEKEEVKNNVKKHKQFIRVFAIFLVLVIFANIVIPNISFASSYDDLKALVTEIENDQTLASTVYTNFYIVRIQDQQKRYMVMSM